MNKFATCIGYVMIGAACFSVVGIILAIVFASNAGSSSNTQARNERATNQAAYLAANATAAAKATATAQAGPTAFPTDFAYPTAGLRPTDTTTPASTPVPTMTAVPLPTATGVPTLTPIPTEAALPTATLEPTATATPSAASTNGLSAADEVYLAGLNKHYDNFGDALIELGSLMESPSLSSRSWGINVMKNMAIIKVTYTGLSDLRPTAKFQSYHADLVDAMSDCDTAMDYMAAGLGNSSNTDMNQGLRLMFSCNQKMKPVHDQLAEILN